MVKIKLTSKKLIGLMSLILGLYPVLGQEYLFTSLLDSNSLKGWTAYNAITPDESTLLQSVMNPGEWNQLEIFVQAQNVKVNLNGVLVTDYNMPANVTDGILAFQLHNRMPMEFFVRGLEISEWVQVLSIGGSSLSKLGYRAKFNNHFSILSSIDGKIRTQKYPGFLLLSPKL